MQRPLLQRKLSGEQVPLLLNKGVDEEDEEDEEDDEEDDDEGGGRVVGKGSDSLDVNFI